MRFEAVRDRRSFAELARAGIRARSGALTLVLLRRPGAPGPRVAFSIGRDVGSAVIRNRVRRRLRELLAVRLSHLPAGDLLIRVNSSAATASSATLSGWLDEALRRVTSDVESGLTRTALPGQAVAR